MRLVVVRIPTGFSGLDEDRDRHVVILAGHSPGVASEPSVHSQKYAMHAAILRDLSG